MEITTGVSDKNNGIFFTLSLTSAPQNLAKFQLLLKRIRTVIVKIFSEVPQVLWDDIGFHYSKVLYPKVHVIENIMRKLITKFMVINVGVGWHKTNVPREVDQSIKTKTPNDYLYNTDFIQLSNLLFNEYLIVSNKPVISRIKKAKEISELDLSELLQLVPTNNWDRYFSPLIDCDADYLRSKWEKLYDYRCIVAHNKPMSETDFTAANKLIEEIEVILNDALQNIDRVVVPEEDREDIAENAASLGSETVGIFLMNINSLNELLMSLISRFGEWKNQAMPVRHAGIGMLGRTAHELGIINKNLSLKISLFAKMRTMVVHSPNFSNNSANLVMLSELNIQIIEINRVMFKMLQTDHLDEIDNDEDPELPF